MSPPLQKVSDDIQEFRLQKLALSEKMEGCEKLHAKFELLEIIELSQALDEFKKFLEKISYLSGLKD